MTKTRFLALITALALLMTIPTAVFAQKTPPHVFVGTATLDGATAVDGTAVTAWVDEEQEAATNVVNGSYVLEVDGAFDGKTVAFRVGSATADQSGTWVFGGASLLNLTASSGNTTTGLPPADGTQGAKGEKGEKGDTGASGPAGADGAAGAAGDPGPAGPTGAAGADGSPGSAGAAGEDGSGSGIIGIIALIIAAVALLGAGGSYMMGRRI